MPYENVYDIVNTNKDKTNAEIVNMLNEKNIETKDSSLKTTNQITLILGLENALTLFTILDQTPFKHFKGSLDSNGMDFSLSLVQQGLDSIKQAAPPEVTPLLDSVKQLGVYNISAWESYAGRGTTATEANVDEFRTYISQAELWAWAEPLMNQTRAKIAENKTKQEIIDLWVNS